MRNDEPYVYQNGQVYRPSITPEQLRGIGERAPAPRPRRNLGAEFRERARLARERREAEEGKK